MTDGKKRFTAEDIAKSLRVCSTGKKCDGCVYHGAATWCPGTLRIKAADLIEEQQREIERLQKELILKNDELLKLREENRWIPATEPNLSKEFVSVLVCIPSDDPLPTVKETYLADGMWVTKAAYYTQQEVTHWRPMPKGVEVSADAQM